ncbi:MAG: response regulator [candidate division Zixibacteria bacterium]|nr:response regulator [candidate division Zixibacteria bacterium]
MRILIAEDSALMRRAIVNVIKKLKHDAVEAENGADAMAILRKQYNNIGLIILDWNMPLMDGYEVLTKVRSDERYDDIPILMATAIGVKADVIKAIKAGADSYIVKPYKPEELSERIQKILQSAKNNRPMKIN